MRILKVLAVIALLLVGLFFFLIYGLARSERRARFINAMNDLKEAHFEVQKYGSFTNHSHYTKVYYYTNQIAAAGINYQCEFAADNDDFENRGILIITTNELFIWIDNKHGALPLTKQDNSLKFPPGF
jgi:lipopolysaccharide export LptBFGC system permease protein LptF